MHINNVSCITDPKLLKVDIALRNENGENVVDMAVDMLQDIGSNAFVRK